MTTDEANRILGTSSWALETRQRIVQIARHRYNVAITGPPGAGKRFLADVLHRLSPRATRPMVPVDCSLLTDAVFASQLFGHEAGAFPGATGAAMGSFRAADGGTMLLANVETLSLERQQELQTALSARRITAVGSETPVPIDVRLVTASHRSLQKEVSDRRLLPELYTLLDAVSLTVVALQQRSEDIAPLAAQFLQEVAEEFDEPRKQLARDGLARLEHYHWPGNVTELRETIERGAVFSEKMELDASSFGFLPD